MSAQAKIRVLRDFLGAGVSNFIFIRTPFRISLLQAKVVLGSNRLVTGKERQFCVVEAAVWVSKPVA